MRSNLSSRGQVAARAGEELASLDILRDLWNPETNPGGWVSLGIAENTLMHKELQEFINASFKLEARDLTYGEGPSGSSRLREAAAAFLNRNFHPVQAIESKHVFVTAGASTAIEHFGFALGDGAEDAYLLGRPYYHAFKPDFGTRGGVKLVEVSFGEDDQFSMACVQHYERALENARRLVNVRALILCTPNNPLGRCYSREVLVELMRLCQKYQIHLVSDEIYGLSVWKNEAAPDATPFTSVLSIDPAGVIDPSLVHVIWGMSKDFGANGLRIGFLISQNNRSLRLALKLYTVYSFPSSASDRISANILEDFKFTDKYIETNAIRLADSYAFTSGFLKEHGIPFFPGANAGFFLWVDLKRVSRPSNPRVQEMGAQLKALGLDESGKHDQSNRPRETTKEIMIKLLEHKVYLNSCLEFGGEEEGWFRIVFSQDRAYLEEGLRRMLNAVSSN